MYFDRADFIKANTLLSEVPLRPDIKLHLTKDTENLSRKIEMAFNSLNAQPPYWATAWPGGQALSRYILDHQIFVAGKRILNFQGGSGLIAIAAAKAAAASVEASESDVLAIDAISMNAAANHVAVQVVSDELLGCDSRWDLILVSDISRTCPFEDHAINWLERLARNGTRVLVGDHSHALAQDRFVSIASYDVPLHNHQDEEDVEIAEVWRFKDTD